VGLDGDRRIGVDDQGWRGRHDAVGGVLEDRHGVLPGGGQGTVGAGGARAAPCRGTSVAPGVVAALHCWQDAKQIRSEEKGSGKGKEQEF